jgi:acetyl esterase/lipase
VKIDPNGPPTFLIQAEDDPVHVQNAIVYYLALQKASIPAEMHIYTKGGHGYGLRPTKLPITHWPSLAAVWLHTIGVLR